MGKVKRKSWSVEETSSATEIFRNHIENKNVPTIGECVDAIYSHPVLIGRSPSQLKAWVNNRIKHKPKKANMKGNI